MSLSSNAFVNFGFNSSAFNKVTMYFYDFNFLFSGKPFEINYGSKIVNITENPITQCQFKRSLSLFSLGKNQGDCNEGQFSGFPLTHVQYFCGNRNFLGFFCGLTLILLSKDTFFCRDSISRDKAQWEQGFFCGLKHAFWR